MSWPFGKRARFRRAPRYALVDFPDAAVGVAVGVATAIGTRVLASPVTGGRCLYYVVRLFELGDRGRRPCGTLSDGVELTLDDGSARAIVDPRGAACELDVVERHQLDAGSLDARLFALAGEHRVSRSTLVELEEAIVAPSTRLAVHGTGSRAEGRLHFAATRAAPLTLIHDHRLLRVELPVARVRS